MKIKVALLLFVVGVGMAQTARAQEFVTIDGEFSVNISDDVNFEADGSARPVAGVVGQVEYEARLAGPDGFKNSVFVRRNFKPGTNDQAIEISGDNALTIEGRYQVAVVVWNVLGDGTRRATFPAFIIPFDFRKPIEVWTPSALLRENVSLSDETDFD